MKSFTYEDIKALNPCYDPIKYIPKDWKGTALDILKLEGPSVQDKFFVVFRQDLVSDKILRLFAVWSYRETLKFIKDPDPRSLKAAEVAEAYALGKATDEDLEIARKEAWVTAWSAWSTVLAARVAEGEWSAEWSAEWAAARSAAEVAAREAAKAAAGGAAWSAAVAAESAAAESAAARVAQLNKLIELLENE